MDLHEALANRRTVQRFAEAPVSDDIVGRALAAAHQAPNHKLTWPWRFTLPGPAARAALVDVNLRLKSASKPRTPELVAALCAKMMNPAHLVVVSQVLDADPFRRQEDYASCCCAIQNLMLSLHADHVGSKWSTGGVTRDPQSFEILAIDPRRELVVGFVWVGLAAVVPKGPVRPPIASLIRRVP